jgi:hypothetical protein
MRERAFEFHQATIYKIENGKRKVSIAEGLALSELVRVPLETLVARDPSSVSVLRHTVRSLAEELAYMLVMLDENAEELERHQTHLRDAARRLDDVLDADATSNEMTAAQQYGQLIDFEGVAHFREAYSEFAEGHEGHALLYELGAVEAWPEDGAEPLFDDIGLPGLGVRRADAAPLPGLDFEELSKDPNDG